MRGNFVVLTVGGYFVQQLGIITGFSYEMNDSNATWDTDYRLPHMIKVSGFNFIPIHNFVPQLQSIEVNNFLDDSIETDPNLDKIEDKNIYGGSGGGQQYLNQNSDFNIAINITKTEANTTTNTNTTPTTTTPTTNTNTNGGNPPSTGTVPNPPDNSAPLQNKQQIINDIVGDTP